jgi:hypothetical protein
MWEGTQRRRGGRGQRPPHRYLPTLWGGHTGHILSGHGFEISSREAHARRRARRQDVT